MPGLGRKSQEQAMSVTFLVGMGMVIGLIVIAALLFLLLSGRDDHSNHRRE
jgi:hypothetical protein